MASKAMIACASLLTVTLLSACASSGNITAPLDIRSLPPVPADIQTCADQSGLSRIPERELTAEDVARLWGSDRLATVKQRQCLQRLIDWHSQLRANWI